MELIYVWIEEFRNIKQCGFKLSKDFYIRINHDSMKQIEDLQISIKNIKIERRILSPKIYNDNICNVTAVVGKNSSGKTNLLTCIGDLLTSFNTSSFILIYFDNVSNKYILECNQIALKTNNGDIQYATNKSKTTIYEFNNEQIYLYTTNQLPIVDLEYIYIRETLNYMLHPNANCFYSDIGRFGLPYDKCGLLYQFIYLRDYINQAETFKNNNITITFEIRDVINQKENYLLKILPEFFPEKKCLFDLNKSDGMATYKKVFMLRFFERVLNDMRFFNDNIIKNERNELLEIISDCDGDIDKLLSIYDKIKQRTIRIRSILMANEMENNIDIDNCYKNFVDQLEETLIEIDEKNFESSFRCRINVSTILNQKEFMDNIQKLLELADESDICLEFVPRNIEININNVSDGLKYLLQLYSTIHKCLKQNPLYKFKSVILILDEPDLHMHPEWSRKLLYNLFNFLKQQFPMNNFQIILSTHSPFILSDIPTENVIFLEKKYENGLTVVKNNKLKTFGANIHTLLKDSFFMESTIGEFAKNQLNEVVKFLMNNEYIGNMNQKKAKYIIESVGEDLIRNKLQRIYTDKYPEEIEDLTQKIQYYHEKIAELQNIIDNGTIIDKNKLSDLQLELTNILKIVTNSIKSSGDKND